jgi:hypothetical protein
LQLRAQTNCKNIVGCKTNKQGRCDCKKIKKHAQYFVFATIFVCVIANADGIFYDYKSE